MKITNMEIQFSEIGITAAGQPRKATYMIVAVLQFDNQKKKRRVYLRSIISDKKSVKLAVAGETFLAVQVKEVLNVYDLEGNLQGAISTMVFGNPIQINKDGFILCKDKTITWITDKGEVSKSRELTEDEYKELFGQ